MNKYAILIVIVAVVAVVGGVFAYKNFSQSKANIPAVNGLTKEFTITIKEDSWAFSPDEINVNRGDRVVLTMINQDDFDHGIAIIALGISERIPAKQTIKVDFLAAQAGDFPFQCSIPCGEGDVHGVKRSHFDMTGIIKVKDIVQP